MISFNEKNSKLQNHVLPDFDQVEGLMTYSISYIEAGGYILVTHEGLVNEPYINQVTQEIAHAINEHQCHKILSDYRKTILNLSTSEILKSQQKVADSISENGMSPYQMKRALVVEEKGRNLDLMAFFETVSVNRSQKVKVFVDIEKAINWITQE